jgi:hypothetical protein
MICILQYYHIINSSCFVLLSCRASDDSAKQQSLAVFSAKPHTKKKAETLACLSSLFMCQLISRPGTNDGSPAFVPTPLVAHPLLCP